MSYIGAFGEFCVQLCLEADLAGPGDNGPQVTTASKLGLAR